MTALKQFAGSVTPATCADAGVFPDYTARWVGRSHHHGHHGDQSRGEVRSYSGPRCAAKVSFENPWCFKFDKKEIRYWYRIWSESWTAKRPTRGTCPFRTHAHARPLVRAA